MVNRRSILHITWNSKYCGLAVSDLKEVFVYINCKGFLWINSNTKYKLSEFTSLITFYYEWTTLRWVVIGKSVTT